MFCPRSTTNFCFTIIICPLLVVLLITLWCRSHCARCISTCVWHIVWVLMRWIVCIRAMVPQCSLITVSTALISSSCLIITRIVVSDWIIGSPSIRPCILKCRKRLIRSTCILICSYRLLLRVWMDRLLLRVRMDRLLLRVWMVRLCLCIWMSSLLLIATVVTLICSATITVRIHGIRIWCEVTVVVGSIWCSQSWWTC